MVLKRVLGTSANHYKVDHLDDLTATVVTNLFRSVDPTRRWKAVHDGPARVYIPQSALWDLPAFRGLTPYSFPGVRMLLSPDFDPASLGLSNGKLYSLSEIHEKIKTLAPKKNKDDPNRWSIRVHHGVDGDASAPGFTKTAYILGTQLLTLAPDSKVWIGHDGRVEFKQLEMRLDIKTDAHRRPRDNFDFVGDGASNAFNFLHREDLRSFNNRAVEFVFTGPGQRFFRYSLEDAPKGFKEPGFLGGNKYARDIASFGSAAKNYPRIRSDLYKERVLRSSAGEERQSFNIGREVSRLEANPNLLLDSDYLPALERRFGNAATNLIVEASGAADYFKTAKPPLVPVPRPRPSRKSLRIPLPEKGEPSSAPTGKPALEEGRVKAEPISFTPGATTPSTQRVFVQPEQTQGEEEETPLWRAETVESRSEAETGSEAEIEARDADDRGAEIKAGDERSSLASTAATPKTAIDETPPPNLSLRALRIDPPAARNAPAEATPLQSLNASPSLAGTAADKDRQAKKALRLYDEIEAESRARTGADDQPVAEAGADFTGSVGSEPSSSGDNASSGEKAVDDRRPWSSSALQSIGGAKTMSKVLEDVRRRQGEAAASAIDEAVRDPDPNKAGQAARSGYSAYLQRPFKGDPQEEAEEQFEIGALPESFQGVGDLSKVIGKRSRRGRRFYEVSEPYRNAVIARLSAQ